MEEQECDRAPYIQMRRALETENVAEFLHAVCSGIPGSNEAVTIARSARMDGRWRALFESNSCRVSGAPSLPLSEIDLTRHERSRGRQVIGRKSQRCAAAARVRFRHPACLTILDPNPPTSGIAIVRYRPSSGSVVVKKSTHEDDGRRESRALVASSLGNCRAQRLDCRGELAAPVRVSRDMTIHLRLGAVEQGLGLRGFGARLVDVTVGLGEQAVETQQPEIAKM